MNNIIAVIRFIDQLKLEEGVSGTYGTLSSDASGNLTWTNTSAQGFSLLPSPTAGNDGQFVYYNDGTTSFEYTADLDARHVHLPCRKASVGTITKGTPVYLASWNASGYIEVEEADASSAATMPAIGVAESDITNTALSDVVLSGVLSDMDTSAWAVMDAVYVASGGGLTNTAPTGTALLQKVGIVGRSHLSNGIIYVTGSGYSNSLPNLPSGQAWIGNGSAVPTATTLATVATSGSYADLTNKPGAVISVAASKTLALADANTIQSVTATATITIPPQSSVTWGDITHIVFYSSTSASVSFAAGAGVTITSENSLLSLNGLGAAATLSRLGADSWFLSGSLA